jgi:hypothetical protein
MLHWNGQSLTREDVQPNATLFSAVATADRVYAVGQSNSSLGIIFEREDGAWHPAAVADSLEGSPPWRGVAAHAGEVYAVGEEGAVARRTPTGWVPESPGLSGEDLHVAWISPDASVWAVGGKFDQAITEDGVMLYRGERAVPPLPEAVNP